MSFASVRVLTNGSLFRSITAFIPGVPRVVGEFKKREFADHLTRHPKNHMPASTMIWGPLWQNVAVRIENKRVLAALNELSNAPPYDVVPHVLCVRIIGFAIKCRQEGESLEWIYTNFPEEHHRQTDPWNFWAAGSLGSIEVALWAQCRGYTIPPEMMDAAAGSRHLDLVRFLHGHGEGGCTTQAMNNAASGGHLDIVQFLHEYHSEGCTDCAHSWSLGNGHVEVLRFLLENRNEECCIYCIDDAATNGHLHSIKFAHEQNLPVLRQNLMHQAAAVGHLDIVKFLHENRIGRCYNDIFREAGGTDTRTWSDTSASTVQ